MATQNSNSKKRQARVRNNISKRNQSGRPRISVFRSNINIYVQLIGVDGNVIQSCSSVVFGSELKGKKGVDVAKMVGEKFAKDCLAKGVKEVVFDKGCYQYSGRVKAVADSCRNAGLQF